MLVQIEGDRIAGAPEPDTGGDVPRLRRGRGRAREDALHRARRHRDGGQRRRAALPRDPDRAQVGVLVLGDILRRHAAVRGGKTAYVVGDRSRDATRAFHARSNQLARALARLGVGARRPRRRAGAEPGRVPDRLLRDPQARRDRRAGERPLHRGRGGAASSATRRRRRSSSRPSSRPLRGRAPAAVRDTRARRSTPPSTRLADAEPSGRRRRRRSTSTIRTSCSTRAAPPARPRARCSRTAATGSRRRPRTSSSASREDDVALSMFPMFHMGGWALPLGFWHTGATVGDPAEGRPARDPRDRSRASA